MRCSRCGALFSVDGRLNLQRLREPGVAWVGLVAVLAVGAVLAWWLPAMWIDWQPGLVFSEPWRAWSAAFVHWSAMHLGANLAGAALVAALGWIAQLPPRAALAWLLAWPITQWGLLLRPELAHYGGLSGVLHGGATVAALWLVARDSGRRRLIGAVLLIGVVAKVLSESPWGPTLRHGGGWDIAIAPLAHATGALAGLICMALLLGPRPQSRA